MYDFCINVEGLTGIESKLIQEHIDRYKWYKGIEDYNKAIILFIEEYDFIIKEIYCSRVCQKRNKCIISFEMLGEK